MISQYIYLKPDFFQLLNARDPSKTKKFNRMYNPDTTYKNAQAPTLWMVRTAKPLAGIDMYQFLAKYVFPLWHFHLDTFMAIWNKIQCTIITESKVQFENWKPFYSCNWTDYCRYRKWNDRFLTFFLHNLFWNFKLTFIFTILTVV